MAFKRPESSLVVIHDAAARVLVLQRQDDPEFWQSVTGTLEYGETPFQTAKREVQEETGIDIDRMGFKLRDRQCSHQFAIRDRWRHRYAADCQFNTEHVFTLLVNGDETITLTEHLNYQWLDKLDAMSLVWSDTNRQAIDQFVQPKAVNSCQ